MENTDLESDVVVLVKKLKLDDNISQSDIANKIYDLLDFHKENCSNKEIYSLLNTLYIDVRTNHVSQFNSYVQQAIFP